MKSLVFAKRNIKEISRDRISLFFCIALPLFLLVIFQQFKIPSAVYKIENFAPGIAIFSFGFITLFSGQLISKDRTTSFLTRLFTSPLKSLDFIFGYVISLLPLAIIQSTFFFLVAALFGLELNLNALVTILLLIPVSIMFISIGILIGCLVDDKQASAIGSIVVQLIAFTSGMWFSMDQVGKVLEYISCALPFKYTLDLARYALAGNYSEMIIPLLVVIGYTIVLFTIAILVFKKYMKSDNK